MKEQAKAEMVKRVVCKDDWTSLGISPHVEKIIQSVNDEFGNKAELFVPILVRMDRREGPEFDKTKRAGVYIFIGEDGKCLKIGKSHQNASKRALEHCWDKTTSKDGKICMADHLNNGKTHMLVFALQGESKHWLLALEYFLEKKFEPRIPSIRNG